MISLKSMNQARRCLPVPLARLARPSELLKVDTGIYVLRDRQIEELVSDKQIAENGDYFVLPRLG